MKQVTLKKMVIDNFKGCNHREIIFSDNTKIITLVYRKIQVVNDYFRVVSKGQTLCGDKGHNNSSLTSEPLSERTDYLP